MAQGPASGKAFGRRTAPSATPARPTPTPEPEAPLPDSIAWREHRDSELEDWKRTRRWRLPWRQISLTASLCFGIAALVLPDSVSDAVQWVLWALAAASFWTGWRGRRR